MWDNYHANEISQLLSKLQIIYQTLLQLLPWSKSETITICMQLNCPSTQTATAHLHTPCTNTHIHLFNGHFPVKPVLASSPFPDLWHTHTTVLLLFWNMSGTTRVSRYQKGKTRKVKTNLNLLEQEIVSGSGICGLYASLHLIPDNHALCQHPTTQFFTGRMPFLPPNQQRQSTEGIDSGT